MIQKPVFVSFGEITEDLGFVCEGFSRDVLPLIH